MGTQSPIKVSQETKDKIRLAAALSGRTQADLVTVAVDEFVDRHTDEFSAGMRRARTILSRQASHRRMTLSALRARRNEILALTQAHGATSVQVFGSVARETGSSRDVDLLVTFEAGRSLLDVVALTEALKELLGCPVDVVEPAGLHPEIRRTVEEEAVAL